MATSGRAETLRLIAGHSTSGMPAFEELLVERTSEGRFKLLRSPGLVLGLAADDVIEAPGDGTFSLVQRGMNLCIQIFGAGDLTPLERLLSERLGKLGGRLDGQTKRVLVYTVSVSAGFPAVEAILKDAVGELPGAEWYFGNVYDPVDDRPLNWWP